MKTKILISIITLFAFCLISAGCVGLTFDNETKNKLAKLEKDSELATQRILEAKAEYEKVMALVKVANDKRKSGELKVDDYAVVFNELINSATVFKEIGEKASEDLSNITTQQKQLTEEKGVPWWYTLLTVGTGIVGGLSMAFPQLKAAHAGIKAAQGAVSVLTRAIGTGKDKDEIIGIVKKTQNVVIKNNLNGTG